MVAANATWASELVAVATSNNKRWQHHQSRWAQLKLLAIAMDAINTFIVRRQSTHKRSPSNATRKAVVINLEATRQPCQRTWQGHCEGVVSITAITIPQWWILPQGRQSPQNVCDERKLRRFADQRRSQGLYAWWRRQLLSPSAWPMQAAQAPQRWQSWQQQVQQQEESPECKDKGFKPWCLHGKHANHLHDKCCANPHNQARKQQQQAQATKNRKKQSRRDTYATRHAHNDCLTSSKSSRLAEPVTPSLVTKDKRERRQQQNYHVCSNPKIKRMLVVWWSGPATATSSWVRSAKIFLDGFPWQGCLDL